ncbi:MAG: hypothetical protein ACRC3Z_05785 [Phocaeicola sp.]
MKPFPFILLTTLLLCSCTNAPTSKKLEQAADKENKRCPLAIASNIQMDSVKYNTQENKLTYYYSLSNDLDNQELLEANHSLLQLQLEEAVESETALLPYRDFGATISYCYYSESTQKKLAEFTMEGAK